MSIRGRLDRSGRVGHDPAHPEQVRRDARRSLHPADAGRQQRRLVAVLDEPPIGVRPVVHRPLDQRVGQLEGELQVARLAGALPGVEEHVTHPGGPAAAAVVVPEARVEPGRQPRGPDAVQATALPVQRAGAGHLGDPGPVQREEGHRRTGRAVAPGVGDRVGVRSVRAGWCAAPRSRRPTGPPARPGAPRRSGQRRPDRAGRARGRPRRGRRRSRPGRARGSASRWPRPRGTARARSASRSRRPAGRPRPAVRRPPVRPAPALGGPRDDGPRARRPGPRPCRGSGR